MEDGGLEPAAERLEYAESSSNEDTDPQPNNSVPKQHHNTPQTPDIVLLSPKSELD